MKLKRSSKIAVAVLATLGLGAAVAVFAHPGANGPGMMHEMGPGMMHQMGPGMMRGMGPGAAAG